MIKYLDTLCEDEEKRNLPSETRKSLEALCKQINDLPIESRDEVEKRVASIFMAHLNAQDQREVAQRAGFPSPNQPVADRLWMIVVGVFALILLGSFATVVASVFMKVECNLLFTIFTTTTAFLAGLFSCPRSRISSS